MPDTDDNTISEGTEADDDSATTDTTELSTSTDSTAENVAVNDPEKNKKLAEITISEKIRETYNLELNIPKILKGIHTNQYFFMDVSDEFYEKNYGTIAKTIADKKFGRYAGFEKGRFFIENVEYWGGIDGTGMKLTLNPLPNNYSQYMKAQQDAEKALIDALTQGSGGAAGGGLVTMNGDDCTDTFTLATTTYDITKTANHMIGNSSANYAQDTASMSGKEALMTIYNKFSYSGYPNNRTCPQKMWHSNCAVSSNCADISRLCMCVGQVHGLTIGIHHMYNHYYNLIQIDGKTYRFDCCCKNGSYRGETTNTIVGTLW